MTLRLWIIILTAGLCSPAYAQAPEVWPGPMQPFGRLAGQWQCQTRQIHLGLDTFQFEFVDATASIDMWQDAATKQLHSAMQTQSLAGEPLLSSTSIIAYDPQQALFVQYETSTGDMHATLHSTGFDGDCVTWRYVADAEHSDAMSPASLGFEGVYCVDQDDTQLSVQYTLRLAPHDPLVLLSAACVRAP